MQFKVCPKCGGENALHASICSRCGTFLPAQERLTDKAGGYSTEEQPGNVMVCSQCNEKIQSGMVRCPHCGAYLNREGSYSVSPVSLGHIEPYGLKGWLIIVGIGLVLSILQAARILIEELKLLITVYGMSIQFTGDQKLIIPLLIYEIAVNGLLICLAAVCLVTYFKKKRIFIILFIALNAGGPILAIIDALLASGITPATSAFGGAMILSVIKSIAWVVYIKTSKRVDNTFVE